MSEIETSSYWYDCTTLTHRASWSKQLQSEPQFDATRSVTWARYPNRYLLTEYANEERRLFRKRRLQKKLFCLSVLSAKRVDTGNQDYSRYFILPTAVYRFHMQVDDRNDLQTEQDMRSEFEFVRNNDLMTPNYEELLSLRWALQSALQDGADPYDYDAMSE